MTTLEDLAEIATARARLDERERELIDRARHGGATWAQIAEVLGLASRQAAEQRRQRLVAAARARRHDQDLRYASSIVTLREAVSALHRALAADPRWPARFVRAPLVRDTVAAALDAPPGGLYALAEQAVHDLTAVRAADLPGHVRVALADVRRALSTEH
ncbi:hypothetical protein Asp14428_25740 [Actinoplanes sp. NBRC 14428]|nr:hypothetical protein Asp14428_25740 [Actinoplanes sp. NBRC 14428]